MFHQKHTVLITHVLYSIVLSATLVTTGCAPVPNSDGPAISGPSPTSGTSREQARITATSAYEAFLKISDEIATQGGADTERLSEVARGEALTTISDNMRELAAAGLRITGSTRVTLVEVYEWDDERIRAYVCEDVGLVDLLDSQGKSLVSPDRVAITPFEIELESEEGSPYLLSERHVWTGKNFCE